MKTKTKNLLLKCGVPPHIKGYYYLGFAIDSILEEPKLLGRITKGLYPKIAQEFETTCPRVERAIRHAIEIGFDHIDVTVRHELFGWSVRSNDDKPTNSHFIAALVEALKEYNQDNSAIGEL